MQVAERGLKLLPAPLQKHWVGDCTSDMTHRTVTGRRHIVSLHDTCYYFKMAGDQCTVHKTVVQHLSLSDLKVDVVLDLLYEMLHLTDNQLTLQQSRIQFCAQSLPFISTSAMLTHYVQI